MISMLEEKNGEVLRVVSDPRVFDKNDKIFARDNGYEYVCRCMPEKNLRYRFAKDLRFYPTSKGDIAGEHSKACPFSDQYKEGQNKGRDVPRDKTTGEIKTGVIENVAIPLSSSSDSTSSTGKSTDEEVSEGDGRVRVVRLIKELNFEISQKQAQARYRTIREISDYNRWVFVKAKEVPLEGRNMMLNDPDTGVKFIYEIASDFTATVKDGSGTPKEYRLSEMDYNAVAFYEAIRHSGYKCGMDTLYTGKDGKIHKRTLYLSHPALKSALKGYIKEHGKGEEAVTLKFDAGYIIGTGYEYDFPYKDPTGLIKHSRKIGRLWLITVSKRGIYSQTEDEADMHEAALSVAKKTKGSGYYVQSIQSPYGIFTIDGCTSIIIIALNTEKRAIKGSDDISLSYTPDEESIAEFTEKLNKAVTELKSR